MDVLNRMELYIKSSGRTKKDIATEMGLNYDTFRKYFSPSESARSNPSSKTVKKMKNFLNGENLSNNLDEKRELLLKDKIQRLELLLLLVSYELFEFRDGSKNDRDVLRKEMNLDDAGYVTALLTNMGNERHFQQWKGAGITFNHFNLKKEE
ncbi:MAG: hypothetical protein WD095_00170 [Candidatus Paceibacterota bacterium]